MAGILTKSKESLKELSYGVHHLEAMTNGITKWYLTKTSQKLNQALVIASQMNKIKWQWYLVLILNTGMTIQCNLIKRKINGSDQKI